MQLPHDLDARPGVGVARRERQGHGVERVGPQAEIGVQQPLQVFDHQPGAQQEYRRQRDLAGDQRAHQAVPARRAARLLSQRIAHVGPGQLQRGREPGQHAHGGCHNRGEEGGPHVHGGGGDAQLIAQRVGNEIHQEAAQRVRDRKTDGRADGGEDQALHQHLAYLPPAIGAERGPDGHVPGPAETAGQQQVGDVGRRQAEEQDRGAHQGQRQACACPDQRLAHRRHREAQSAIRNRPRGLGADGNRLQLRLGGGRRRLRRQAREHRERCLDARVDPFRDPGFHVVRKPEPRRQDAHDRGRAVLEADGPADRVGAAAELPEPQRMTDNDDARVEPGLLLVRGEQAAVRGPDAEHIERAR